MDFVASKTPQPIAAKLTMQSSSGWVRFSANGWASNRQRDGFLF